jgi:non-ribosomal peptide synthetase component E (peptide arylation enzyme)
VALVAMPDPRLGERACAFVVVEAGAEEPTVQTFQEYLCGLGVAKFKWPGRVEIVPLMPRTSVGKIQKAALRELAANTAR